MKAFVVTVEIEMAVVADNAQDAELLARKYLREEDPFAFSYYARELKDASALKTLDSDLADCYPWGAEGDKTLRQILTEMLPPKEVPKTVEFTCVEHGSIPQDQVYESETGGYGHAGCWKKVEKG